MFGVGVLTRSDAAPRRTVEQRFEPRTLCRGAIRLRPARFRDAEIDGDLMDVSDSGFRVSYKGTPLLPTTEVQFVHQFFQGSARVAWSRTISGRVESGFQVIRD